MGGPGSAISGGWHGVGGLQEKLLTLISVAGVGFRTEMTVSAIGISVDSYLIGSEISLLCGRRLWGIRRTGYSAQSVSSGLAASPLTYLGRAPHSPDRVTIAEALDCRETAEKCD